MTPGFGAWVNTANLLDIEQPAGGPSGFGGTPSFSASIMEGPIRGRMAGFYHSQPVVSPLGGLRREWTGASQDWRALSVVGGRGHGPKAHSGIDAYSGGSGSAPALAAFCRGNTTKAASSGLPT